jgi:heavy-metal resistance protein
MPPGNQRLSRRHDLLNERLALMKKALCSLIAFAAIAAFAQAASAQTPPPAAGQPHNFAHGGGMDNPLGMLAHLQAKLNLNTSQQQQFDAAVAQGKASREIIKANMQQLHAALETQVATGAPDLDSIAALVDTLQPQNLAARKQARAAWLALYDTFSAAQKAVVANAIQRRMARTAAWRERFRSKVTQ